MRTRIGKWGHSLAVRIPKAFAEESGFVDKTEVDMTIAEGKLVISTPDPGYTLENLVKDMTPDNRHEATDWGDAVGRESW